MRMGALIWTASSLSWFPTRKKGFTLRWLRVGDFCGVKAMTTGFESIDIVLDYVDKGVAIVELAKKLGITMDQVMAFGDNLNDLHMMQVVGHPVAPENARPEILELAKTVIGHHKDQSVIAYMEGL